MGPTSHANYFSHHIALPDGSTLKQETIEQLIEVLSR